ncbi:MAG: ABC transporter ATP-binding protein [Desulfuromonas sp.]|nr:MAG: ABC transporter ATP-binding protein [Desulfuromonas sp.]
MTPLLEVRNLKTFFFTDGGITKAVGGIDFSIHLGETLALVGESGCGKSMTALSLLRLVPSPGRIVEGEILFKGDDLLRLPPIEMQRIRGNRIAMIFQEPMTSLNPVFRVGDQIAEVLQLHRGLNQGAIAEQTIELLHQVGIPEPELRSRDYPHQLSGGMRQRVVIAMALAGKPQLLIADEPTTALDVTIQAQIMDLLDRLRTERSMATLLISHDLGIVAENADKVAIMYAGLIVESATTEELFNHPLHPYTEGLLACVPKLGEEKKRLAPIPGQVPSAANLPAGCSFRERCPYAFSPCSKKQPSLQETSPGHFVRCWKYQ